MPRLSLLRHFIVVNPLMVAAFPRPTGGRWSRKVFLLAVAAFISGRPPVTILNDRIVGSCEENQAIAVSRSEHRSAKGRKVDSDVEAVCLVYLSLPYSVLFMALITSSIFSIRLN